MLNVMRDPTEPTRRGFVTNYPHFRHWRREAGAEGVEAQPLNVYLHTPYCIQRCAYCFYKTTTLGRSRRGEIDRYVAALCREIEVASERFHLKERPTTTLYFGGGTPTVLTAEHFDRIMGTLSRCLTLVDPEITVEGEPVTLTARKAALLQRHGVNRISVGIQSFCDEIVLGTGRRDTEEKARRALEVALGTGAVVNIDLISGLLGETGETWAYTIDRAIESGAHSITIYKLELYANSQYYADLRRQRISLPSDTEELRLARYALDTLRAAGYPPINFFTFTRGGGYEQRHITSQWQGVDTYGFGASAFGSMGHRAYQNLNEVGKYVAAVEAGELPLFRGYVYSSLDLMVRDVILGMKLIHLDRARFRERHGVDLVRLCAPVLERLEAEGFVTVSEEAVSLTEEGILLGDHTGRVLAASLEELAN